MWFRSISPIRACSRRRPSRPSLRSPALIPRSMSRRRAPVNFAQATVSSPGTATDRAPPEPPPSRRGRCAGSRCRPAAANALRGTVEVSGPAASETTAAVTPPAPAAAAEPAVATQPAVADPPKPAPDAADPAKATPLPASRKTRALDQPVKRTGTVAVFISRKEKKLFVRQGFEPLFESRSRSSIPSNRSGPTSSRRLDLPTMAPACAGT